MLAYEKEVNEGFAKTAWATIEYQDSRPDPYACLTPMPAFVEGRFAPADASAVRIGNSNHLFWPEQYRRTGEFSIALVFEELTLEDQVFNLDDKPHSVVRPVTRAPHGYGRAILHALMPSPGSTSQNPFSRGTIPASSATREPPEISDRLVTFAYPRQEHVFLSTC